MRMESSFVNSNKKLSPFYPVSYTHLAVYKRQNMSVMMPYADSLKLMADWYAQLWACLLYTSHPESG